MTYLAVVWKVLSNSPGMITVTFGNMMVLFCFLRPRWKWYVDPVLVGITYLALPMVYKLGTAFIDLPNVNSIMLTVLGYWSVIIILIAFGEGFFQTIALVFTLCILNRMFTFCGYVLHISLNSLATENINVEVSVTILMAVMYTLISLVCWIKLRQKGRHLIQTQLHRHNWAVLAGFAVSAKLIIDLCSDYAFELSPYTDMKIIWAMIALCCFSVTVLILYLYSALNTLKRCELKATSDRLVFEKEAQQRYYEAQLQNQEELRRMKHDMNGHLTTVSQLLADDNKGEATHYIESLVNRDVSQQKKPYSSDPYVNAVVSNYSALFTENDTTFECEIQPGRIDLHHIEMCMVLSNALQNALEASVELPSKQRYVRLQIKTKHNRFLFRITNRFKSKIIMDDGIPRSTKNVEGHGYGLRNIRRSAESTGGFAVCKNDGDMFILDVSM